MTCLHCKFGLAVNILILCLFLLVNLASCYLPVKTASLPVDTTNVGTEHLPVDIVHQLGVWFKKNQNAESNTRQWKHSKRQSQTRPIGLGENKTVRKNTCNSPHNSMT